MFLQKKRSVKAFFAAMALVCTAFAASAATIGWNEGVASSDNYTDSANWSDGITPVDGDIAVFGRSLGDVTVKFPASGVRENSTTKVCLRSGTSESHAVWITFGGLRDAVRLVRDLKSEKIDISDNGSVANPPA